MICGNPPYRRTILYAARAVTEAAAFPYCRRDERGIPKTAVTRCFAERDERGHQVARAVTEAAAFPYCRRDRGCNPRPYNIN